MKKKLNLKLSVLIVSIFFISCSVKVERVSIKTNDQKVFANIKLTNYYKDNLLGGNYIHEADIKWFEQACLQLDIDDKISINYDTTEVQIDLDINGFERANELCRKISERASGFDLVFVKAQKNAVVWMYVNPTIFNNRGELLVENGNDIADFMPNNSNHNFNIIRQTSNSILFEIHVDTSSSLNKAQQITYNYALRDIPPITSEVNNSGWGLTNKETWIFICTILGGIVSFVTIKNYKYKAK